MQSRGVLTSEVFGTDFFSGGLDTAARVVIARARSGAGGYACLCNVHVLMTAQRNAAVRKALGDAWMVFPDGAPVAWLERRSGARAADRIAGADLMLRVFDLGREIGLRHYLYGSTPEVVSTLRESLQHRFTGAKVVGLKRVASVWARRITQAVEDSFRRATRCGLVFSWGSQAGALDESVCRFDEAGSRARRRGGIRFLG